MGKFRDRLKQAACRALLGGIPVAPADALWELIDAENRKPANEIRCDRIEAWREAAARVRNYTHQE